VAIISCFENPQKGQVIMDCNNIEFMVDITPLGIMPFQGGG